MTPGFQFDDLRGKTVVLTGATRGIGKALAPGLLAQGIRLILVGRDAGALDEVVRSLRDCGEAATWVQGVVCDLANPEDRARASAEIAALAPTLDGLIHNAAIDPRQSLENTSLDFFRNVMATNVEPSLELTRDLLPNLKRSSAGRVVLVGSITFDVGTAYLSAYTASKGALVGLTRSLAHELGEYSLTINCLSPGAIVVEKEAGRNSEETDRALIGWQSVRRRLVPNDLLAPLCLLLSETSGGISGQVLTVDGGLMHPIAAPGLQGDWLE